MSPFYTTDIFHWKMIVLKNAKYLKKVIIKILHGVPYSM